MGATSSSRLQRQSLPILIASLLLLPLVMIDAVRISHRFVGPLFRVRNTLRALSSGHSVSHITYRDGDYWKEFADDVNQLIDYVESLRRRTDYPQPSPAEPLVASSRPTP
ncbi:MAG: hypothetical protein KatS3mg110_4386 [Pirellulaceae bacterium]|nr:MAG: hypothetical protein KatS3mg110_4386 [Pirellulaceae bacterium]